MRAREFSMNYLDFRDKPLTRKGKKSYKLLRKNPRNYMYNSYWMTNCMRHCDNKTPNIFYIKAYNSKFSKMLSKRFTDNLLTFR